MLCEVYKRIVYGASPLRDVVDLACSIKKISSIYVRVIGNADNSRRFHDPFMFISRRKMDKGDFKFPIFLFAVKINLVRFYKGLVIL